MGVLYAKKIVAGEINYSDVKKLWQAKTLKALQDMVASDEITEEQYNELISKQDKIRASERVLFFNIQKDVYKNLFTQLYN